MTDLPPRSPLPEPSGDEADLLASLYLDGEATPEERSRVEADPALLATVERFRMIAVENADVHPPAGLAELQIAAALDVFDARRDELSGTGDPARLGRTGTAPVTALAERRARRSSLPTWLGAAAVSAIVIGGLGIVATRGTGGDDEVASVETTVSASASNAVDSDDSDTAAMEAPQAELADGAESDRATEADEATMDAVEEELVGDDAEATEEGSGPLFDPKAAADFYAENGPIDLAEYDGTTAADYYQQLLDLPLQPIEASPCADSPLVAGLFEVDRFIPVIFDRQQASLVVRSGSPSTALIIGSTCEISLS